MAYIQRHTAQLTRPLRRLGREHSILEHKDFGVYALVSAVSNSALSRSLSLTVSRSFGRVIQKSIVVVTSSDVQRTHRDSFPVEWSCYTVIDRRRSLSLTFTELFFRSTGRAIQQSTVAVILSDFHRTLRDSFFSRVVV